MFQKHANSEFLRKSIFQVCTTEPMDAFKVLVAITRQSHLGLTANLHGIEAELDSEFEDELAENVFDHICCTESDMANFVTNTLKSVSEGSTSMELSNLVLAYNASMEKKASTNIEYLTHLIDYLLSRNLSKRERPANVILPCEMKIVSDLFEVTPPEFQLRHKDTMLNCAELSRGEDEELRGMNVLSFFHDFISERIEAKAWVQSSEENKDAL